jgi:branched-chain amino acid transport system substrate-binding protein
MLVTSTGIVAADGPVLLGAVYNLSGPQAAFDEPSARGAELAAARANAAGGVLGRQVKLVIADPGGSLDRVAAVTGELIDAHPSIAAVLGLSDTDMVLAAAPVAAGRQRLFMTAGATSPKLPAQVPEHLFLACFGDNVQAAAAAEFAYHDLAARTASIIYNAATTYTTLLQAYYRARFEELGGRIVATRNYGDASRSRRRARRPSGGGRRLPLGPGAGGGGGRHRGAAPSRYRRADHGRRRLRLGGRMVEAPGFRSRLLHHPRLARA